jgi:hypothetical protein
MKDIEQKTRKYTEYVLRASLLVLVVSACLKVLFF